MKTLYNAKKDKNKQRDKAKEGWRQNCMIPTNKTSPEASKITLKH